MSTPDLQTAPEIKRRVTHEPTGISRTLRRFTGGADESAPKRQGRPSDFDPYMVAEAAGMLQAGATVIEVCEAIGITEPTFYRWVRDVPGFSKCVAQGKAAQLRVEASLYGRAVGKAKKRTITTNADGSTVERVEELPPDPRAQHIYLMGRGGPDWLPRQQHELIVPDAGPELSPEELDTRRLALAAIALMNEAAEQPLLEDVPYDANTETESDGDQDDWEGEPEDLDL